MSAHGHEDQWQQALMYFDTRDNNLSDGLDIKQCLMALTTIRSGLINAFSAATAAGIAACEQSIIDRTVSVCMMILSNRNPDDKYLLVATRDVLSTIFSAVLVKPSADTSQPTELSTVHDALSGVFRLASTRHDVSLEITALELLSLMLSSVLKRAQRTPVLFIQKSLDMFDGFIQNLSDHLSDNELVMTAIVKCLEKYVKIAKRFDAAGSDLKLSILSVIRSTTILRILDGSSGMQWRMLLKMLRHFTKYVHTKDSTDMTSAGELQLSQYIIHQLLDKLLRHVPIPMCCGVSWQLCSSDNVQVQPDFALLRVGVLILLNTMVRLLHNIGDGDVNEVNSVYDKFKNVCAITQQRMALGSNPADPCVHVWLFELFLDQDDLMSDALLALQDLYLVWSGRWKSVDLDLSWFQPIELFKSLLTHISHDHTILVDFVLSPETSFLPYFHSLLQHIIASWHKISLQLVLDKDLSESESSKHSNTRGAAGLLSLTDGMESLLSYNDMSSDDDEDICYASSSSIGSYDSDSSCDDELHQPGARVSLETTLQTLENTKHLLIRMKTSNQCPYNVTQLISLLNHIRSLSVS